MKTSTSVFLLAALWLGTGSASAAEYIIASLVGDRVSIVNAAMGTGSNLERQPTQVVKMAQLPFDDALQEAVANGVAAVDTSASFKAPAFREGLPGVESIELLDQADIVSRLLQVLAPVIKTGDNKSGEKQWIVALWPSRAEHSYKLIDTTVGRGKSAGLGYYIDRYSGIQRVDTAESDRGFLGVFAYFTVALIDPATRKVVAQKPVQGRYLYPFAGSRAGHPWEVLDSKEKLRVLTHVAREEVVEAMPGLMAAAK